MSKIKIKAEQFVRVWIEAVDNGETIGWIAKTLNTSDNNVHTLARNLRANGVKLPSIRRPFVETIKIDQLNKLIAEKFGS